MNFIIALDVTINYVITVLIFLVLLSVLVLVHELGHFIAAKKLGVTAEEFGLGLPPKITKLFVWKGTEFSLNWLPIGGFVRMRGEDAANSEFSIQHSVLVNKGYFYAQKPWKRATILLAGVTMNMLLGILAFSLVYFKLGIPQSGNVVRIDGVAPGSPAEQAQLRTGDVVKELQANRLSGYQVTETKEFVEFINNHRGEEITLVIKRGDEEKEVAVTPRIETETPEGEGALGVAVSSVIFVRYPWWQMPFRASWVGLKEALAWGTEIFSGLVAMVVNLITLGKIPTDVAGPVGIAKITGQVASKGWVPLVQFAGILSVNLAIVNVLPIPALDGGRLLFLGIEKLLGRPINPKKERWANLVGYGALITLILLATIQDFFRIFAP